MFARLCSWVSRLLLEVDALFLQANAKGIPNPVAFNARESAVGHTRHYEGAAYP